VQEGRWQTPVASLTINVDKSDVSDHVAWELLKRVAKGDKPLTRAARRFVEFHLGEAELLRAGIAD